MEETIYVAKIAYSTSVDGVGLRNALYVSGCPIRCAGCHNKQLWDLQSGVQMSIEEICDCLNVDDFNISILGGEPLMQYASVLELCKLIKARYPHKTIWLWSGFTVEHIQQEYEAILHYIDVLVDGPYMEQFAVQNLKWRGSTNQRIIETKTLF